MRCAAQPPEVAPGQVLARYYQTLLRSLGPQRWWPARTRLEIILGAILTQNTNWRNVTLAIEHLRQAGFLRWAGLRRATAPQLESCVRPAGYFRQKARTIREFVEWLEKIHRGSLNALFAEPPQRLRNQLLELRGLGPETVDAILLYAGRQPYFVADAYTRRVLIRHELIPPDADYAVTQKFIHQHFRAGEAVYNEFHALLVETGKRYCRRSSPQCGACPLKEFLPGRSRGEPHQGNQTAPRRRQLGAPRLKTGLEAYGHE